jgi:hypothetical protein
MRRVQLAQINGVLENVVDSILRRRCTAVDDL